MLLGEDGLFRADRMMALGGVLVGLGGWALSKRRRKQSEDEEETESGEIPWWAFADDRWGPDGDDMDERLRGLPRLLVT